MGGYPLIGMSVRNNSNARGCLLLSAFRALLSLGETLCPHRLSPDFFEA